MSVEIHARYLADRSVGGVDPRTLRGLNLTPKEAFFLSRIEGLITVGDLVSITGMDRFQVSEVLNRLVELGVVLPPEGRGAERPAATGHKTARPHATTRIAGPRSLTSWSSNLREQAKERKKQMLARQVSPRAQRSKSYARLRSQTPREPAAQDSRPDRGQDRKAASTSSSRVSSRPHSRTASLAGSASTRAASNQRGSSRSAESDRPRSHSAVIDVPENPSVAPWELQAIDESKLDAGLAIEVDRQRELLQIVDMLELLSPFDLLGISACDDYTLIRKAFIQQSRWLHPDAYHGKDLGIYRDLLEKVFHRVRKAYESLADPQLRAHYKKSA